MDLCAGVPSGANLPSSFRLSAVIPVFNEVATIGTLLQRVRQTGLASQIIIVDDGSTDGTREVLRQLAASSGITVLDHACNRGKGASLRTALPHVTRDAVV